MIEYNNPICKLSVSVSVLKNCYFPFLHVVTTTKGGSFSCITGYKIGPNILILKKLISLFLSLSNIIKHIYVEREGFFLILKVIHII